MTAALIIGIVAVIGAIGLCVFIALRLSDTVHRALITIEQSQRAYAQHLDKTLDRLMTIRWEDFVSAREFEEGDEEGGFMTPDEQRGEVEVEVPGFFGLRPLHGDHDEAEENEERLVREDFMS
jgi:hypothetical protein